ncbi:MAG: RNA methyltransferase, partial [Gemmatimonadota bacterium]
VSPRLRRAPGGDGLMSLLTASGFPLEEVSDEELEALSDTEQSQGVLMVVREPHGALGVLAAHPATRVLLLDGVQDPGNAGTLIRAAQAFGLSGVFALEGTVDSFNPKVVRASAGALAHIPVVRLPWAEVSQWLEERKMPLMVADALGEDVRAVALDPPWALAVGNEGAGVREELMERAARVLAIPMDPGVDSLNAGMAGAILLFALSPFSGKKTEN